MKKVFWTLLLLLTSSTFAKDVIRTTTVPLVGNQLSGDWTIVDTYSPTPGGVIKSTQIGLFVSGFQPIDWKAVYSGWTYCDGCGVGPQELLYRYRMGLGTDYNVHTVYSPTGSSNEWHNQWPDLPADITYYPSLTIDSLMYVQGKEVTGLSDLKDVFVVQENSVGPTDPRINAGLIDFHYIVQDTLHLDWNHAITIYDAGDLGSDGSVDASDAATLFALWNTGFVDFNRDGFTDAADAGIMFGCWTGDSGPVSTVPEASTAGWIIAAMVAATRKSR